MSSSDDPSASADPGHLAGDSSLRDVIRVRTFRLYIIGHFISMCGNAMQQVGIAWLVIELTGSGTALGGVILMNYVPAFVVGPWGGLIADRVNRRRGVLTSQVLLGGSAVALAVLVLTDSATLWLVYAMAFFNGAVLVVDMPLRQVLVHELVSDRGLHRAISLTTSIGFASRTFGPSTAGLLIVTVGLGSVFLVNAVTFVAVITSLLLIRPQELHLAPTTPRGRGQLRAGVLLIWRTPVLRSTFVVLMCVGTFGFSFNVVLPLIASISFEGGADAYGLLAAVMAIGSVAGSLLVGIMPRPGRWRLGATSAFFGATAILVATMPNLAAATTAVAAYGVGHVFFVTTCNVAVQLAVPASTRGRVMAFYGVIFWGSMAVGGLIAGALSDLWGPRGYMAVSGVVVILIGAVTVGVLRPSSRSSRSGRCRDLGTGDLPAGTPAGHVVGP